ncbi:MAG: UDP-N-acetyl-D-mannosamine dehydrogenase [Escherichia coli]|nr:UDP-N-acetyl-D-mannosamine dehydrogenase [Escherichia coli]
MSFATISVIGLGYIGLPTAAAFASRQKQVIGVDINQHAVDTINRGEIHIVEPDLASVVKTAVEGGFLRASTTPVEADAWLIAVPTPFKGDHEPDMTYVESAARSIAPVLKKGALVILESTSPVGSTEKMAEWLAEMRPDLTFPQQVGEQADVNIAYCPERVLPGQVMVELIKNDRVIGGMTPVCSARASELYKIFLEGECVVTNSRTAEMCKLTENSFRDVNIAFAETLVVEPNIHQLPKKLTGLCTLAQLDEALATADVLVMLVDHSQFKVINGDNVHQQYVVDAKGVWR